MDINQADTQATIRQLALRYEQALISNDIATLDELFWQSPHTVRLGASENLFGYEQICAFRHSRSPKGLARTIKQMAITTFGEHSAVVNIVFERAGEPLGRQSQTWIKLEQGWRIVSAHVSQMKAPG